MTPPSPTDVFRAQVRKVRLALGLSQQDLAERLTALNGQTDRVTVVRTEKGTRGVSLDEAFLYAAALGVSPTKLMSPDPPDDLVAVAPRLVAPARRVRRWIRGKEPLGDYLAERSKGRFAVPGSAETTFYGQVADEDRNKSTFAAHMEHLSDNLLQAAMSTRLEIAERALDAMRAEFDMYVALLEENQ